jgi:Ser-tRNA(Ala) deacylase AlaX
MHKERTMPARTIPLYLLHPAPVEQHAKIISRRDLSDGRFAFVADSTVFYPASGGQPSDVGAIRSKDGSAEAAVERVTITGDAIEHLATPIHGSFAEGSDIAMSVDRDRRMLHSRLHSAGELLCSAVRQLGHDWYVSGASHYPQQSRIVYDAALTEEQRQGLHDGLNAEIDYLLRRNDRVRIAEVADRAEAARLIGFVPDYVPTSEPVRIVFVSEGLGRPCCGTHVVEISEIGRIVIRKIRIKKKQTSISYDITP